MAQEIINIGAAPDDETGDNGREGGDKINKNFTELYDADEAQEVTNEELKRYAFGLT